MENGFLLINKPATWTSHDVVGYMRRVTHIKRIGHAGTLDPFATGLLIVAIGRENTKRLDELFKGLDKTYVATLRLGATSDTFDKTGVITEQSTDTVSLEVVQNILTSFVGEQDQLPPMYSAKKVDGKKLYKLARKGIEVERKAHHITIYSIELLDYTFPDIKIRVRCSTGTYIRSLVHDIGQKLGVGAYCEELERVSIGKYSLENATPIKDFSRDSWKDSLL
jgi:tRNA pseudouridine55 synthase